jgi:hypothetical protein
MTHKKSAHGEAVTLLLTGHDALPTLQPPSMGSVVAKELHARNELPPYVWIPQSPGNSSRGGFLGANYNQFNAAEAKKRLLALTPASYTGLAADLAKLV